MGSVSSKRQSTTGRSPTRTFLASLGLDDRRVYRSSATSHSARFVQLSQPITHEPVIEPLCLDATELLVSELAVNCKIFVHGNICVEADLAVAKSQSLGFGEGNKATSQARALSLRCYGHVVEKQVISFRQKYYQACDFVSDCQHSYDTFRDTRLIVVVHRSRCSPDARNVSEVRVTHDSLNDSSVGWLCVTNDWFHPETGSASKPIANSAAALPAPFRRLRAPSRIRTRATSPHLHSSQNHVSVAYLTL